ncbi:MAG: hypothetical protein ACRESS_09580 [Stenotrophobium sp.]
MCNSLRAALATLALATALMTATPLVQAAAKPAVTSVSAQARPAEYSGDCPAALEFVGTFRVSHHPVVVEYVWERSNHSRSAVRRIQARGTLQTITDEWGVGGPPGTMQVWEKLIILSPNSISSAVAKATVNCQ